MEHKWVAVALVAAAGTGCALSDPSSGAPFIPERTADFRGGPLRDGVMPARIGRTVSPAWEFDVDASIKTSPAITGHVVIVTTGSSEVVALDRHSGQVQWRTKFDEGSLSSPVISGGLVVFGSRSGVLHGLHIADGSTAWTAQLDSPELGAPTTTENGIVTATEDGAIHTLDPFSGSATLKSNVSGQVRRSLAVGAGLAFVPTEPGGLSAVELSSGTVRWTVALASAGAVGTPATDGRRVWTAVGLDGDDPTHRAVVALDANSGADIWRYASPTSETVYSPAIDGGKAFIVGEDGKVVAMDAATGRQEWAIDTGAALEALPVVAGGVLLVAANGGSIAAYREADGSQLWSVPIDGVPYSPTAVDDLIVVATDLGVVYAFLSPPD